MASKSSLWIRTGLNLRAVFACPTYTSARWFQTTRAVGATRRARRATGHSRGTKSLAEDWLAKHPDLTRGRSRVLVLRRSISDENDPGSHVLPDKSSIKDDHAEAIPEAWPVTLGHVTELDKYNGRVYVQWTENFTRIRHANVTVGGKYPENEGWVYLDGITAVANPTTPFRVLEHVTLLPYPALDELPSKVDVTPMIGAYDRYGDRHIVDKTLNFDRTEEIMPDQYVFLLGPHVKFPVWLSEHTNVLVLEAAIKQLWPTLQEPQRVAIHAEGPESYSGGLRATLKNTLLGKFVVVEVDGKPYPFNLASGWIGDGGPIFAGPVTFGDNEDESQSMVPFVDRPSAYERVKTETKPLYILLAMLFGGLFVAMKFNEWYDDRKNTKIARKAVEMDSGRAFDVAPLDSIGTRGVAVVKEPSDTAFGLIVGQAHSGELVRVGSGVTGLKILKILEGYPASRSDLKVGDVIAQINEEVVLNCGLSAHKSVTMSPTDMMKCQRDLVGGAFARSGPKLDLKIVDM